MFLCSLISCLFNWIKVLPETCDDIKPVVLPVAFQSTLMRYCYTFCCKRCAQQPLRLVVKVASGRWVGARVVAQYGAVPKYGRLRQFLTLSMLLKLDNDVISKVFT